MPKSICLGGAVILSVIMLLVVGLFGRAIIFVFNLDWLIKYVTDFFDSLPQWVAWTFVVFGYVYWAYRWSPGLYQKCWRFWHEEKGIEHD